MRYEAEKETNTIIVWFTREEYEAEENNLGLALTKYLGKIEYYASISDWRDNNELYEKIITDEEGFKKIMWFLNKQIEVGCNQDCTYNRKNICQVVKLWPDTDVNELNPKAECKSFAKKATTDKIVEKILDTHKLDRKDCTLEFLEELTNTAREIESLVRDETMDFCIRKKYGSI